jgi:membrane protein involved in colicin uptake
VYAGGEPVNAPRSEGVSLNEADRQAYEDMLHRDEAFWQDIEDRKKRLQEQREEQLKKKKAEAEARAKADAAAAAAAEAETNAKAEAEAEAARKAQAAQKQNSFSISGTDEDAGLGAKAKVNRKGSWNEEKDKELMSELESLTSGALAKAANDAEVKGVEGTSPKIGDGADVMNFGADDFEELEDKELMSELASLTSEALAKTDDDAELKELEGLSPKAGDGIDDVMNFGADDFEELEEYLSGLSTK